MMSFSEKDFLAVGDLVEHPADSSREGQIPQGQGLITGVAKGSIHPSRNVWYVTFFNGMKFRIMESYLKKIQGTVDIHE